MSVSTMTEDKFQAEITKILEDPIFDNDTYAVGSLFSLDISIGTGMYLGINKETRVVEVSHPCLPAIINTVIKYNEEVNKLEISQVRLLHS